MQEIRNKKEIIENMEQLGWHVDVDYPDMNRLHLSIELPHNQYPLSILLEGSVQDWDNQIGELVTHYSVSDVARKYVDSNVFQMSIQSCIERTSLEFAMFNAIFVLMHYELPQDALNSIIATHLAEFCGMKADNILMPGEDGMRYFFLWFPCPSVLLNCDGNCEDCNDDGMEEDEEDDQDPCQDEENIPPDLTLEFQTTKQLSDRIAKIAASFQVENLLSKWRTQICENCKGEDACEVDLIGEMYALAVCIRGMLMQFLTLMKKYLD